MNKIIFCILFVFIFSERLFSIENYPAGARAVGLSNAYVSFSDVWSAFHNQAGLSGINSPVAGVFYESRFLVDELSMVAGTFVIPSRTGNFGVSFFQFGKGSFKENKFGLAYAKKLSGKISGGIQLDYFSRILPEDMHTRGFATFEGGVIYNPSENIFLGAHVFNIVRGGIETVSGIEKMPIVYRLGGHYFFDKTVLITIETEKSGKNSFLYKSGIEFSPVQNLAIRFGVSGKPVRYTAGIGYKTGNIQTDIAFSYHGNLGLTPSVSIQIGFK